MLTQCPSCHTSFRITSSILRVAHGQVRCGRCDTQFDALQSLIEEETTDEPALEGSPETVEDMAATPAESGTEVIEEPLSEEITLEGRRIEISGVYRTLDEDEAHTQTIVQEFLADGLSEFEPAEEISVDSGVQEIEAENYTDIDLNVRPDPYADSPPIRAQDSAIETPIYSARRPVSNSAFEFDLPTSRSDQAPRTVHWTLLSVLGVLVLAAQWIHHYRQDLSRRADVGPYLGRLYTALGLPLQPRWNLNGYAVKQWGVVSDPNSNTAGGILRVRASIANHAEFPQPYPLLKLTLEDRFGEQVGSREFKPEEYLSSAAQAKRLLNTGESANADIAIVDPGEEAVGFHLNVCLPLSAGLACAG